MDPDANGDGIPDCRRDDALHYKLIKSPSGLIKKVLRIRKPTKEEQHMSFMITEAKRKLIKFRTKLNQPEPKKPLQTPQKITQNLTNNNDNEELPSKFKKRDKNTKNSVKSPKKNEDQTIVKYSRENKLKLNKLSDTLQNAQKLTSVKQKKSNDFKNSKQNKQHNRKLANFDLTEYDLLENYKIQLDQLQFEDSLENGFFDLATAHIVGQESNSFWLPGAAAATDETAIRKAQNLKNKAKNLIQKHNKKVNQYLS